MNTWFSLPASGAVVFLRQVRKTLEFVRLAPFDTSTTEGRSRERYRRVALSTVTSAAAKAIAILTTLVAVPLTVGYLGVERYGLWMALSSAVALLGFGDFGIGLGLLNAVSEADGRKDLEAAREYVSSAFYLLLGVGVVVGTVFAVTSASVSWGELFNVRSKQAAEEALPAISVLIACFAANIPLWTANRVNMGYQEGYVNSAWEIAGNLAGLGGLLLSIHFRTGLPILVLAVSSGPLLASMANGIVLFTSRRPRLLPRWKRFRADSAGKVFRLGALFFIMQMAGVLMLTTDNLVVARVLGVSEVTRYAVPMKLFGAVPLLVGMILVPLWPAYGEAISSGDAIWVRRTLVGSVRWAAIFSLAIAVPLAVFGKSIVHAWVGPEAVPPLSLLLGMGVWTVMNTAWGAVAMFLNGASALRAQAIWSTVTGAGALGIKIVLARSFGLSGVIWGTVIAQGFLMVLPLSLHARRLLETLAPVSGQGQAR